MNTKAMTLIEIMISILLISIVLSAIVVLIPQVMINDQKTSSVITATSIGQDRLECAEEHEFRKLYELVETDESISQNDIEFKRTTVVGYQINSVTATTITDTDQTWTTNEWQYCIVTIATGTAKGTHYQISSNDSNTITCSGADFTADGVSSGDYYYIGFASVEVAVAYKVTIEATIKPFKKDSSDSDIGLKDSEETAAGVEYKHPTGKWQDIILKTILVENE